MDISVLQFREERQGYIFERLWRCALSRSISDKGIKGKSEKVYLFGLTYFSHYRLEDSTKSPENQALFCSPDSAARPSEKVHNYG